MKVRAPNFDPIARPYRWLEYLTFGTHLERCRYHFLPELGDRRRALILGDGDGRFTAKLLAANPRITVEVVDSSREMLRLLAQRVACVGPSAQSRLQTRQLDARQFTPEGPPYDLVATHFFLDCLSEGDLAALIERITPQLSRGAIWLVSEFAIPSNQPAALISRLLVGALYRTFAILTSLKIRSLPDYTRALTHAGFLLHQRKNRLGGLLKSELWSLNTATKRLS